MTVTAAVVLIERVAVKVTVPVLFSAIEAALLVSVTVGALSFSVIVIVCDCVPLSYAFPPETPVIAIIPVSFPS